MGEIYRSLIVSQLEGFYGDQLTQLQIHPNIKLHLSSIAQKMWEGYKSQHSFIFREISNYHSKFLGKSNEEISQLDFSLLECQQAKYKYKDKKSALPNKDNALNFITL